MTRLLNAKKRGGGADENHLRLHLASKVTLAGLEPSTLRLKAGDPDLWTTGPCGQNASRSASAPYRIRTGAARETAEHPDHWNNGAYESHLAR